MSLSSNLRTVSSTLSRRLKRHPRRQRPPNPKSKPKPKPKPKPPPLREYTRHTIHRVSSLLRTTPWADALPRLTSPPLSSIRWDSHLVCKLLKTHPPLHKAWLFFLWSSTLPTFRHDRFTYTTMLDLLGEAGRIASMESLLLEMDERGLLPDAVTYTAVMRWRAEAGDMEGAERAWCEMRERGLTPTLVSYTAYMKALLDRGRAKEAMELYAEMVAAGIRPSCHTYTVIMGHLAGAGKFQAVLDVMNDMQVADVQLDKAACNILVQRCSHAGEIPTMLHVLQYMKEHKLVLRHPVFIEAVKAFKLAGKSDDLLREVNPHLEGIEEEYLVSESCDPSSLIDRNIMFNLLARQDFTSIGTLLTDMVSRNVMMDSEVLSAIVEMTCMSNRISIALLAFKYCVKLQKMLDKYACTSLIGLLIRSDSYEEMVEVVEEMMKWKINLGTHLVSILIQKFSSVGMVLFALKIFQAMYNDQNTMTYTAIISAFFENQDVNKALELFDEMCRRGIHASLGTFEVLISGLEKVGRVQEAEVYRKKKKKLKFSYRARESVSAEETMCNILYDTPMVTGLHHGSDVTIS